MIHKEAWYKYADERQLNSLRQRAERGDRNSLVELMRQLARAGRVSEVWEIVAELPSQEILQLPSDAFPPIEYTYTLKERKLDLRKANWSHLYSIENGEDPYFDPYGAWEDDGLVPDPEEEDQFQAAQELLRTPLELTEERKEKTSLGDLARLIGAEASVEYLEEPKRRHRYTSRWYALGRLLIRQIPPDSQLENYAGSHIKQKVELITPEGSFRDNFRVLSGWLIFQESSSS